MMSRRPATDPTVLALELAAELRAAPDGLTCDELARCVRRRRSDVLAALRADPLFQHRGRTRGSRWRISLEAPPDEALGRNESAAPSLPRLLRRARKAAT